MSAATSERTRVLLHDLESGVDPLQLATSLLRGALDDGDFAKSVANCHTAGVDSVVLYDDHEVGGGMVRFYLARHGQHDLANIFSPEGHFVVGIHNHRYDIAKIPLNDVIVNVRTAVADAPTGVSMFEYVFCSALAGEGDGGVGPVRIRRQMQPLCLDGLAPGDVSLMAARELHTVQVPERAGSVGTAWLVVEGPRVCIQSLVYSPRADLVIDTEDLYAPMDADTAAATIELVLALTENAQPIENAVGVR
jgi:hypothetical protein